MLQKAKNLILSSMLLFGVMTPALAGAAVVGIGSGVASADNDVCNSLISGVDATSGSSTGNAACSGQTGSGSSAGSTVGSIAKDVINVFSIIVGAASVFMLILGGFKYITSGGDSNKVGGAKNTIIYALVGLIVVVLAQVIVHFVISSAVSDGGTITNSFIR